MQPTRPTTSKTKTDTRPPAIVLERLLKRYNRSQINALNDVSLTVTAPLARFNPWKRLKQLWWASRSAQITAYAEYWRQLSRETGPPTALVYVALGDSAAQGVGATSAERGYVGLIAGQLRRASGRPVRVINLSRSGAVIGDVLRDQLPQLKLLRSDIVTVAVGGNDVWQRASLAELQERFGALAVALPAGTVLADAPCFGGGPAERKVEALSLLVEQLCRQHQLIFVPLHQATHPHRRNRRHYARDWFHPSDAGYRVWAEAIWAGVERRWQELAV